MLPFILINILVSAVVVLTILYLWEGRQEGVATVETAVTTPPPTPNLTQIITNTLAGDPASDAPVEEEGPPVHVVRAGETLGTISQVYSVTIDDIVAMNSLDNPNILSVGQELIIPIGGLPTATPPPTAEPLPSGVPDPIATEALSFGDDTNVQITAVVTPGELSTEAVQLINSGADPIALLNWKLVAPGGQTYTFGQVTLFGEGAGILVHSTSGQNGATDVYWGRQEAVWESGQLITLQDADGESRATYIVP
jgi:LysM repeat protein